MRRRKLPAGVVRLRPRDLGYSTHVSGDWISNGYWAVKKARVSNAALFGSREVVEAWIGKPIGLWADLEQRQIDRILNADRSHEFRLTAISVDWKSGRRAALLLSADGYCWIDTEILDLFGLSPGAVLYGSAGAEAAMSPVGDAADPAAVSFVVTPISMTDAEKLARDFGAFAAALTRKGAQ